MDADTLRAILSAQAAAQDKMLQAVMKEMRGMFSSMTSTSTTAHATSAEFVTNSLSARLPEFTHHSENGCTFNVWYSRYEDIITQDGATLDEAAKARLIVSKLDAPAYAHFTNHILPRKAAEISLAETVKTLQKLFGHNTSVFARRYAYLKFQCNGESLRDYTGLVNRRHEMAEFNAITAEQMKCLVWNCGLAALEYADIRTHALRKLESNPETTLRELSAEVQQLLDIRQDAKLMCSPPPPPRRYAYLKSQCNGESLRDYTGLVNRRHEMAEFNAITAEQMKCLVWNCGLAALEYATFVLTRYASWRVILKLH
nr:gag-pol polyprotein [Haemonchus contortus]